MLFLFSREASACKGSAVWEAEIKTLAIKIQLRQSSQQW